jgi:DNA-binding MarR family transcriptional regulator
MSDTTRTAAGTALSNLVLDLFKLNNQLLTEGDRLVGKLGLTSARWQVLGTIVAAEQPQSVACLAREMGANRQNIQRIINDLEKKGLVSFAPNPHHRRASLVILTDQGQQVFDYAMYLQIPWINQLANGLSVADLQTTHKVITAIHQKLEE